MYLITALHIAIFCYYYGALKTSLLQNLPIFPKHSTTILSIWVILLNFGLMFFTVSRSFKLSSSHLIKQQWDIIIKLKNVPVDAVLLILLFFMVILYMLETLKRLSMDQTTINMIQEKIDTLTLRSLWFSGLYANITGVPFIFPSYFELYKFYTSFLRGVTNSSDPSCSLNIPNKTSVLWDCWENVTNLIVKFKDENLSCLIFPKGQMLVASPHNHQFPLTHEFPFCPRKYFYLPANCL